MFFQDFDNEDPYPMNGTLEEKAIHSLEQMRTRFWWEKKNYLQNRAGGARHTATMAAFGARSAESMAKHAEASFQNYLKQSYLTEEGETTDPKYPTDKMINSELRRIRAFIILNVAQYMEKFSDMMIEDPKDWTYNMLYFNLYPLTERYVNEAYDQINIVIPNRKMPPRSPAALEREIDTLARTYSEKGSTDGYSREYLVLAIRDSLTQFLLHDLPFNNDRLEKKDELIPKPEAEGEPKKVLH